MYILLTMYFYIGVVHSTAFVIIMAVFPTEKVDIEMRVDEICYLLLVIMKSFKSQSGESTLRLLAANIHFI